jgi:hypothetical protein
MISRDDMCIQSLCHIIQGVIYNLWLEHRHDTTHTTTTHGPHKRASLD